MDYLIPMTDLQLNKSCAPFRNNGSKTKTNRDCCRDMFPSVLPALGACYMYFFRVLIDSLDWLLSLSKILFWLRDAQGSISRTSRLEEKFRTVEGNEFPRGVRCASGNILR